MITNKKIEEWCKAHLFGKREVQGVKIELTPTQKSVMSIAVEIIQKWETGKDEVIEAIQDIAANQRSTRFDPNDQLDEIVAMCNNYLKKEKENE